MFSEVFLSFLPLFLRFIFDSIKTYRNEKWKIKTGNSGLD